MKVLATLLITLEAVVIATNALPIGYGHYQQQTLAQPPQIQPASSVNSFNSGGSSLESAASSGSKLSKLSALNPFRNSNNPSSSTSLFRCHRKPDSSVLNDLANYITDLFKTYRDELFDRKGDPDRIPFEVCMGGYESGGVLSPSIFFKAMTKRQLEKMEKLARNQIVKVFPGVRVEVVGKGMVLVQERLGAGAEGRWVIV
ncbi:MAG: hypothetical protein Q9164_005719 [Protoblastenia rupestris]